MITGRDHDGRKWKLEFGFTFLVSRSCWQVVWVGLTDDADGRSER
jgi:hypothetical protein